MQRMKMLWNLSLYFFMFVWTLELVFSLASQGKTPCVNLFLLFWNHHLNYSLSTIGSASRGNNTLAMPSIKGGFHAGGHVAGVKCASEYFWRYSWAIWWSFETFWQTWLSSWCRLLIHGRLCWQVTLERLAFLVVSYVPENVNVISKLDLQLILNAVHEFIITI